MATVFVSHSSADKHHFVRPLVSALQERRHAVWYDARSVRLTDSIPLMISEGLEKSDHAVIVISRDFLESQWCLRELAAIIMGFTSATKKIIVVRLGGAEVPELISDIRRIELDRSDRGAVDSAIQEILRYLDQAELGSTSAPTTACDPSEIVGILLGADEEKAYGSDLLRTRTAGSATMLENEGLILVKPGGTFYEPCLRELVRRISAKTRIRQVRLFNGRLIAKRHLFDLQYAAPTKIALGDIPITQEDLDKIHEIYDSPEFARLHGVPYSDSLISPALAITREHGIGPLRLSCLWEQGRLGGRFHNNRPDGLNKIGYQKSVYPIKLPKIGVRLVLNGFIPGYRHLFTQDSARVVAIHVSSELPWHVIRDEVVGGNSDPRACPAGSLRRDAYEGRIPLDPQDSLVNGQRNVCHSSATLLDGMYELGHWFEREPAETVLGQVCRLGEAGSVTLDKYSRQGLAELSWSTRGDDLSGLLFEVRLRQTKEDLRGDVRFRRRIAEYSRSVDESQNREELIAQSPALGAFVEDGLRLAAGGDEMYQHAVASVFRNRDTRVAFLEVAHRMQALAKERSSLAKPEIVASAYKIAAGDLMFTDCPAYQVVDSPQLFRSTVIGELAEQALECGQRTESNLVRDLRGSFAIAHPSSSQCESMAAVSIEEHPAWSEFVRTCVPLSSHASTIAIILAGGRSTRMASTIPKAALPLGGDLLLSRIKDTVRSAAGDDVEVFAAVGFRADVVEKVIGDRVRYLRYGKTLGLAFRVAAALEVLKTHEGRVLVTYADMPDISITTLAGLLEKVENERTFALVESQSDLSGHIIRREGRIEKVVQSRLTRPPSEDHTRDVGAYAFCNTAEFRGALRSLTNENVRGEFIFADIVGKLVEKGWDIVPVRERPELARGVNTSAEMLSLACGLARMPRGGKVELESRLSSLDSDYLISASGFDSLHAFRAAVESHSGPMHFFQWWNALWS